MTTSIYDVLGRNSVHPFPARMAPTLAMEQLRSVRAGSRVLDPMVGSGTVVALARAAGHRAIGFDLDPLAVLAATVWTRSVDLSSVRRKAEQIVERVSATYSRTPGELAYPSGADEETKSFIRYWFDLDARKQLRALSCEISRVRDASIRKTLWCALSRQIVAKQAGVSLALDLAHSRPHRHYTRAPRRPISGFLAAVDRVLGGMVSVASPHKGPVAQIFEGDARDTHLRSGSIDLVLTSPPYLNAIDYLRCSKFSLVWMGYSIPVLREIRSKSVGTEVGADRDERSDAVLRLLRLGVSRTDRETRILRRYIGDCTDVASEAARVLRRGGKAVFVVGENTLRGRFIPTGRILTCVAEEAGLKLRSRYHRSLPESRRYLPPPGHGGVGSLDGRMRREVILTFAR